MSAFVVDPEHIAELAVFAASGSRLPGSQNVSPHMLSLFGGEDVRDKKPHEQATYYARVLWAENVRSVRALYPDDRWGDLPGPMTKPLHVIVDRARMHNRRVTNPVALLSMCACLEYQSCETDDYRQTLAYTLLDAIRKAAINQLPGYEDAPWEFRGSVQAA